MYSEIHNLIHDSDWSISVVTINCTINLYIRFCLWTSTKSLFLYKERTAAELRLLHEQLWVGGCNHRLPHCYKDVRSIARKPDCSSGGESLAGCPLGRFFPAYFRFLLPFIHSSDFSTKQESIAFGQVIENDAVRKCNTVYCAGRGQHLDITRATHWARGGRGIYP